MHSRNLIFAQVIEHLPEKTLARWVARYRGNHKIQRFNCQEVVLVDNSGTQRHSLPEIVFHETEINQSH